MVWCQWFNPFAQFEKQRSNAWKQIIVACCNVLQASAVSQSVLEHRTGCLLDQLSTQVLIAGFSGQVLHRAKSAQETRLEMPKGGLNMYKLKRCHQTSPSSPHLMAHRLPLRPCIGMQSLTSSSTNPKLLLTRSVATSPQQPRALMRFLPQRQVFRCWRRLKPGRHPVTSESFR